MSCRMEHLQAGWVYLLYANSIRMMVEIIYIFTQSTWFLPWQG